MMHIENKYWNNYIGDSDDSLTLVEYLADKQSVKISLEEIFFDLKLDKLNGNFRRCDEPITTILKNAESEGDDYRVEFYFPINIIVDSAAILLECKVSGKVDLCDLFGDGLETPVQSISIVETQKEKKMLKDVLTDFVANPLEYDLSRMCPKDDMLQMAGICENLQKELFG